MEIFRLYKERQQPRHKKGGGGAVNAWEYQWGKCPFLPGIWNFSEKKKEATPPWAMSSTAGDIRKSMTETKKLLRKQCCGYHLFNKCNHCQSEELT